MFPRSGTDFGRGFGRQRLQEVFAVTIVASGRGQDDVLNADVFSWSEMPELLAAEDLFEVATGLHPGRELVARGDEDDDFDDDEEEEDDDEEEEDEEYEDEDDEEEDVDDEEWEEVDDEEEEDEEEEEGDEEEEDEDWEDDDEDWEDDDEDEEEDDDDD
jgi:hypothetical protein